MIRSTDGKPKDTLNNIKDNKKFVVNIVTEELAEAMNLSSMETTPEVNEFELADLTPAVAVKTPRVAETPSILSARFTV